jgi:mannose-6-phosphate isomerase
MTERVGAITETRPWGSFTVIDASAGYQVKRIEVEVGRRQSYQRHLHRAEHWVVVAGVAAVLVEGAHRTMRGGDSIDIPRRAAHRLSNGGHERLVVIEVQRGDYLGEDDIERLDDDFGRTAQS